MSNPYRYTDEEYAQLLEGMHTLLYSPPSWGANIIIDPEWSKEETDYLFQTIEDYDSRFFIIHDRYEYPGGVVRPLEVRILLPQFTCPSCSDP